jgi:hypothetical protein
VAANIFEFYTGLPFEKFCVSRAQRAHRMV